MMTYLQWYMWAYMGLSLLIGCVAIAFNFEEQRVSWRSKRAKDKASSLLESVLLVAVCVIFWPIILLIALIQNQKPELHIRFFGASADEDGEESEFQVLPEHLDEFIDIAEVELAAMVNDPLNAVPAVPFGHLNARWRALLSHFEDGCHIRKFSLKYAGLMEIEWGLPLTFSSYWYSGYAVVNSQGNIRSYWVTAISRLPD